MDLMISIVVHSWDESVLFPVLQSLSSSLSAAAKVDRLGKACLWLSYNGAEHLEGDKIKSKLATVFSWPLELRLKQPNLGYGGTHNLVLRELFSAVNASTVDTAVLVMNPDVLVDEGAIAAGLKHLGDEKQCGLMAPHILTWHGDYEAIGHKRYPSLLVLSARMFRFLQAVPAIKALNDRYQYHDLNPALSYRDIELCSGCFMFARLSFWQRLQGFDSRYFMYFEDFDLAYRGREQGWQHHYLPEVTIRHAGGEAGAKNWRHRIWFIRSALRFFSRHGWQLWKV
jgi:hypothetical protein